MIITNQKIEGIERSEGLEEVEYRMEFNPEVAMLLSKDLYSNSIDAVVREIGSNAFDAGIESGNTEVPFEIHLPSQNNLFFAIRDYGPGLSHTAVRGEWKTDTETGKRICVKPGIYNSYFVSTKTHSDKPLGGFGIGSKTPFAYTDSFTVTSWHRGVKAVYVASKNEIQMPVIAKMFEEPSDEPSGLEVRLAVDSCDIARFHSAVRQQLRFLPVKPRLYGASFSWTEPEYEVKTERYGILKDGRGDSRVVVGVIGYNIDARDLGFFSYLNNPESYLLNKGIHLFVGIGDVKVALNRESLRFDGGKDAEGNPVENPGKALLREILAEAVKELPKKLQGELDLVENLWEARIRRHELEKQLQDIGYDNLHLTWRGEKLPTKITLLDSINPDLPPGLGDVWKLELADGRKYGTQVEKIELAQHVTASRRTACFYVNDLEKGSRRRAFYDMRENSHRKCYLVPADTPQEFFDLLGVPGEMIVRCSDLEEPPKGSREGSRKTYTFLRKYNPYGGSRGSQTWEQVKVDYKANPGYYVVLCRDKITLQVGERSRELGGKWSYGYDFLGRLGEIGIDTDRIYGVRPSDLERIRKYVNWRPLGEVIVERMEAVKETYLPILSLKETGLRNYRLESILDLSIEDGGEGSFGRLKELYELRKTSPQGLGVFEDILTSFDTYKVSEDQEFLDLQDAFFQRYPLLEALDRLYGHEEHIREYVGLMDARNVVEV